MSLSKNVDLREYPPIRERSPPCKDQQRLAPWRPDRRENSGDARSDRPGFADFLLLAEEWGSGRQTDHQGQPDQGTVGYAEERSQRRHVLGYPVAKHLIRRVRGKRAWNPLEHWVVLARGHLGQFQRLGICTGQEGPIHQMSSVIMVHVISWMESLT